MNVMTSLKIWCLIIILLVLNCSDISKPDDTPDPTPTTGAQAIYTAPAGPLVFTDTITTSTISGKASALCSLKVAKITSGITAPVNTVPFRLLASGADSLVLKFKISSGEKVLLFTYGPYDAIGSAYHDSLSWIVLPGIYVNDTVTFELPHTIRKLAKKGRPIITGWTGFQDFSFQRVPENLPLGQATRQVELLYQEVVDHWLTVLPPAMADTLRTKMALTHKPSISVLEGETNNGYQVLSQYYGFARPICQLTFNKDVTVGSIAHEFGHYLSHVFAGDDVYKTISDLAPDASHGVGVVYAPRVTVTEEYAYLSELFMTGRASPSRWDPTSVREFLYSPSENKTPDAYDYVSMEGFPALCAYRLFAPETIVVDYEYKNVNVPALGIGITNASTMMKSQATTTDEWFASLLGIVTHNGKKRAFWTSVEPLGYTYSVNGRVLDTAGKAIPDAHVMAENIVNTKPYHTQMSTKTGSDGTFWLRRCFADSTTLVVTINNDKDTFRIPFFIDPSIATNKRIENVDLKINNKGAVPTIKSVNPPKGASGELLTLKGSGFGKTAGKLYFNGSVITSESWSDSVITLTAQSGTKMSEIYITAGTQKSNSGYYYYGMSIRNVLPMPFHPGDSVKIIGKGFNSFGVAPMALNVLFGNKGATVLSGNDSILVVKPYLQARSGNLLVITGTGSDSSNAFAYTIKPPEISKVSPDSIEPGDTVYIRGKGFGDKELSNDIIFRLDTANYTSIVNWSDSLLRFIMPSGITKPVVKIEKGTLSSTPVLLGISKPSIAFSSSLYEIAWGDSVVLKPVIQGTTSITDWFINSVNVAADSFSCTYRATTSGIRTDTIVVRLKNDTTLCDTMFIRLKPKFLSNQTAVISLSGIQVDVTTNDKPNGTTTPILKFPEIANPPLAVTTAQGYELKVDTTYSDGKHITGNLVVNFSIVNDSIWATSSVTYAETKTDGSSKTWSFEVNKINVSGMSLGNCSKEIAGTSVCGYIKNLSYTEKTPWGTGITTVTYSNLACFDYSRLSISIKKP